MSSVHPADDVVYVAFDASTATLVAAILRPGEESATTARVAHNEPSIRRFVKGFPEPARLRACYEAGPTAYELQRLLSSVGVPCVVVAPSLIPTTPGNRVKADTRDARHLVRQFRAGRAHRDPGAYARRGGGARSLPRPRRRGGGPDKSEEPPRGLYHRPPKLPSLSA